MKAERPRRRGHQKPRCALLEDRDSAKPFLRLDPLPPIRMRPTNCTGNSIRRTRRRTRASENRSRARIRYDSEIAYTDESDRPACSQPLPENTRILFTADHGEEVSMSMDYLGHGRRLYQPSLHIPLLLRFAGRSSPPYYCAECARRRYRGDTSSPLAGPFPPRRGMIGIDLRQAETASMRGIGSSKTYGGGRAEYSRRQGSDGRRRGPCGRAVLTPDGWKTDSRRPENRAVPPAGRLSAKPITSRSSSQKRCLPSKGLLTPGASIRSRPVQQAWPLDKEDIRALEKPRLPRIRRGASASGFFPNDLLRRFSLAGLFSK